MKPTYGLLPPKFVLTLILLITAASAWASWAGMRDRVGARFDRASFELGDEIDARLATHLALVRGASAFVALTEPLDDAGFERYVAGLDLPHRERGLEGIAVARLSLSGGRHHAPVLHEYPHHLRGLADRRDDLLADPASREAVERACATAGAAITSRGLAEDREPSLVLHVPVYIEMSGLRTTRKRGTCWGVVVAPVRTLELLHAATEGAALTGVGVRIRSGDGALLFENAHVDDVEYHSRRVLPVAGEPLEIELVAPRTYATTIERWLPPAVAGLGIAIALLVYATMRSQEDARRRAEEAAARDHRLVTELERGNRALARSNRELDEFAYAASHDLRSPLRSIATLADWLEEDLGERLDSPSREHLGKMRGRLQRLETMVDALLRYARAGRALAPTEVDAGRILTEVVTRHPERAGQIVTDAQLPTVRADPGALCEILQQLVSNAFKHGGRDDVTVHVELTERADCWELVVRDDGNGIPPGLHERIWNMFETGQPRDQVDGTGLGLPLVRKLAEAGGGRCWVVSPPGRGAAFHVTLPK